MQTETFFMNELPFIYLLTIQHFQRLVWSEKFIKVNPKIHQDKSNDSC